MDAAALGSLSSPRVVTTSVDTPDAEQLTTPAEENLVRELISKSSYESGCLRPVDEGTGITRKELHVRVERSHARLQSERGATNMMLARLACTGTTATLKHCNL